MHAARRWHSLGWDLEAHVEGLVKYIKHKLCRRPYPTTIIFHIGTNNVFQHLHLRCIALLRILLWGVRGLLPHACIVWSDILLGLYYSASGRRVANFLNTFARRAVYKMENGHFVCHKGVFPLTSFIGLFRLDGLHMSEGGCIMLRMSLAAALVYFNCNPSAKVFPPIHNSR